MRGLLLTLALAIVWSPGMVRADDVETWFEAHSSELVKLYEHFHAHPELSFHEKETAAKLAEELKSAGFEVTSNVGGHGLVGLLKNGDGPTVMFRTDLDGLPVIEETGLPYASKVTTKDDGGTTPMSQASDLDFSTLRPR